MQREEWRGLLYAAGAVTFFSTSPVLTIWADPLSPFVKTGGRLAVAALALGLALGLARWRRGAAPAASPAGAPAPPARGAPVTAGPPTPRSHRATGLRFTAYGLIAALHFLCYVASLSFTSPAHSLTLVYTAPIFVAICAAVLLHEPIRQRQWAGILIAIAGVAVLANPLAGEPGHPNWWLGDLLALGSAVTFGLYSVAGRYERARYSLFQYATGVYGAAALWLLPAVLWTWPAPAARAAIAPWAWLAVLGLGLLPLALGHTLYTASLRRVHAAYVNVIAAQEVTGGVLLSWLLLGLAPTGNEILGGGVALVGIVVILL